MNVEALTEAVNGIKDKTLKANAEGLISRMTETISGIGDNDMQWRPSTLKLVQSMSDTSKLPDGAKAGSMVLGNSILENGVPVIPLRVWDSRLMWHPDTDRDEIICQSPDAKQGFKYGNCRTCEHSQWVEGEGVRCNKTKNVICVTADLTDVFVVNFSKSRYAMGTDWEKRMRSMKTHPYRHQYTLESAPHPKYKKVFVINADVSSDDVPVDALPFLEALFDRISEDREASVQRFYEGLKARENSAQLEDKSGGADRTLEVSDQSDQAVEGDDDGRTYTM